MCARVQAPAVASSFSTSVVVAHYGEPAIANTDNQLTKVFECIATIDSNTDNGTSRDLTFNSATDLSGFIDTKGIQIDSVPRQTSSKLPGETVATLFTHADTGPSIAESHVGASYGTSNDFKLKYVSNLCGSGASNGIQIDSTPHHKSSILGDSTGATLTCHSEVGPCHTDVGPCSMEFNVNAGKVTASDFKLRYAAELSCPGTSKGIQIHFARHHKSSNLPSGTCATIFAHADTGSSIAEVHTDPINVTSGDLKISSATYPCSSGTTKGMQIDFAPWQTSNNLAGGTGATLSTHVVAMQEDYVNAGECGNVTTSNHEHSSSVKIRTNRHSGDSSVFSASAGCSKTFDAVLRDSELAAVDMGGNEWFFDDSIQCVLLFQRCSLSGLPHHLTRIVICPQLFSVCRRCADAFLHGRTVLGQYQ
eukprot:SAG31_NODE_2877_length_4965_cov_15.095767_2_plen_421_part_00